MRFTFDPVKDKLNINKHGLSLGDAKKLDWQFSLCWMDIRKDYGEERFVALVPMDKRLYCVVYVDLKISTRIISLRKANNREIDRYEKEID